MVLGDLINVLKLITRIIIGIGSWNKMSSQIKLP